MVLKRSVLLLVLMFACSAYAVNEQMPNSYPPLVGVGYTTDSDNSNQPYNGYIGLQSGTLGSNVVQSAACAATPLRSEGNTPGAGTFTFEAQWVANECKITLDRNGGTSDSVPATLYTVYNVGAYLNSSRTSGQEMDTAGNYKLTTLPIGANVTVTWDGNNQMAGGQTFSATNVPSPDTVSKVFAGFSANSSGGTQYISGNGNITLDGISRAKAINNSNGTCNDTWYAKWDCPTVTLPSAPSMEGYTFGGWYTAASGGDQFNGGQACIDTTYYAHWSPQDLQVRYDCNTEDQNSNTPFAITGKHPGDPVSLAYGSSSNTCVNGDAPFSGWSCQEDVVSGDARPVAVSEYSDNSAQTFTNNMPVFNVVCTANWGEVYHINYNCGKDPITQGNITGGTTPSQQTVQPNGSWSLYGEDVARNCLTAAHVGFHFKGWACDYNIASGVEEVVHYNYANATFSPAANGSSYEPSNDTSCTAEWEANKICLTWQDANGSAINNVGPNSCTYGATAGASGSIRLLNTPTKTGYTFVGWKVISHSDTASCE